MPAGSVKRKLAARVRARAKKALRWVKSGARALVCRTRAGVFTLSREGRSYTLSLETPEGAWVDLGSSPRADVLKRIAKARVGGP